MERIVNQPKFIETFVAIIRTRSSTLFTVRVAFYASVDLACFKIEAIGACETVFVLAEKSLATLASHSLG